MYQSISLTLCDREAALALCGRETALDLECLNGTIRDKNTLWQWSYHCPLMKCKEPSIRNVTVTCSIFNNKLLKILVNRNDMRKV